MVTESSLPAGKGVLDPEAEEVALRFIRDALRGMQFGTVTATVQDGVVIQIERTEKKRLPRLRQAD
jgi:hypothetical protein